MRELKHHEKKLLKKTDFYEWKNEKNLHQVGIIRKYRLKDREDYNRYNKICGLITKLVSLLKVLKHDDKFRVQITHQLLDKLYDIGLINTKKSLELCEKIAVSCFCRRRLPVVLTTLKYTENLKESTSLIEQGHITIGTETVNDPNMLVTRRMEDNLGWSETSKIKRKVLQYHNKLDDFDLL